jgi:hypothetical protein
LAQLRNTKHAIRRPAAVTLVLAIILVILAVRLYEREHIILAR